MSSIENVIAAARRGGTGFSERKRFTLARGRAIEKMRKFALADPYFYVLELMQGAIANSASYLDLQCADGDVTLSYVGGGLTEEELGQLFDFLFASKERVEIAHVRAIALGVNAALLFEPKRIIIESGDGSAKGTSRLVLEHGADTVDVGRADRPLSGTFIRIEGMNRRKVARKTGRRGDDEGSMEYGVVESRCLAAPVPIIFNGHPMFGFRKNRIPGLFGYQKALAFDEGDIYGILGEECFGVPAFQVLTWGVWVQSYKYQLLPGHKIGGIVCFDRLHKTADHSGFVQDERMEEMWLRLRSYARQLVSGQSKSELTIRTMDGKGLSSPELRELLAAQERVVAVDVNVPPGSAASERARVIARALDAVPLRVPEASVSALSVFGGKSREVFRPRVDDDTEVRFYTKAAAPLPAKPWLASPITLPPLEVEEVASAISGRLDLGDEDLLSRAVRIHWVEVQGEEGKRSELPPLTKLKEVLALRIGRGPVTATIYAPENPGRAVEGLLVQVLTAGRKLWSAVLPSAFAGNVLRIEVPGASPSEFASGRVLAIDGRGGDGSGLARLLAEVMASRATAALGAQTERVLEGLSVGEIKAGSGAAKLALSALVRTCVVRLRGSRPGRLSPGAAFSLTASLDDFDPLSLPLLPVHEGPAWSLRDLALRMDDTGGLVYGTNPDVAADLEGLDLSRVLDLDAHSERMLIAIIGEGSYVRVDGRDVVAAHGPLRCRDFALGLMEFPDFPLLVEAADPSSMSEEEREAALADLLEQLVARFVAAEEPTADASSGSAPDPRASEHEEELRRQAMRHLQWYVCRRAVREPTVSDDLTRLPLFLDIEHHARSFEEVMQLLSSAQGGLAYYGHQLGEDELDVCALAWVEQGAELPACKGLALSVFSYRLLLPLGKIRLAFDFDLEDAEATANPMTPDTAFMSRVSVEAQGLSGVVGVPVGAVSDPRIHVQDHGTRRVIMLGELAREYGVVGSLRMIEGSWEQDSGPAVRAVQVACRNALEQLLSGLSTDDRGGEEKTSASLALLSFAGRRLRLLARPDGHGIDVLLNDSLAERILMLPMFPTGRGTPTSGQRLVERFSRDRAAGVVTSWNEVLSADAPPPLRAWVERTLCSDCIGHVASWSGPAVTQSSHEGEVTWEVLAHNVERWIHVLRPDARPEGTGPTKVWVRSYMTYATMRATADCIDLSDDNPLVRAALSGTPESLAWLILACYAFLNEILHPVTNEHERRFQLELSKTLVAGELRLLPGTSPAFAEPFADADA